MSERTMNNGTKLDTSKSMFKPRENKETQADFEKKISEYRKNEEEIKKRAVEFSNRFIGAVNDQTLPANKGIIGKDVENELIKNIAQFAMALNTDDNQPESIGSVGICQILMNAVLLLRNRVNELSYKVCQLENKNVKEKSSGE